MNWLLERSEDVGILRYFIYVGVMLTGMTLPVTSKLHSISHLELEKVPSFQAFLVGFTGLHMFLVWLLLDARDASELEVLVCYFFLFRGASFYIEFATSVPAEHIVHTPEGRGYQLVETNGSIEASLDNPRQNKQDGNVENNEKEERSGSDVEAPVVVIV